MSSIRDLVAKYKLSTGSVSMGDSVREVHYLPTGSPSIDRALNGGIPMGMITTVVGEPSTGKTTLCISTAIQAQRLGKTVVWNDTEFKINMSHAKRQGLDTSKLIIISATSIEEAVDVMTSLMVDDSNNVGLVVWDSIAQSFSNRALNKTNLEGAMASSEAGSFSRSWPRLQAILQTKEIPMLCTNQWRIKGIGNPTGRTWRDQYGGGIIRYAPSVIIGLTGTEEVSRGGIPRGQQTSFRINKSQVSTPYLEGKFEIDYDDEIGWYGVSFIGDLISLAQKAGLVTLKGAWYSYQYNETEIKGQGISNFKYKLSQNPDAVKSLVEILVPDINYVLTFNSSKADISLSE